MNKLEVTPRPLRVHPSKRGELNSEFPFFEGVDCASAQDGVVSFKKFNSKNLPHNPKLKQRAKEFRKAGILAEVLFWQEIKGKKILGLDFDRQKIIGNYIVDFYCKDLGLVIEIDGSSHDRESRYNYDQKRKKYLELLGLKVVNFLDSEVNRDAYSCVGYLKEFILTNYERENEK